MKKPEPAPTFEILASDPAALEKIFKAASLPELLSTFEKANTDYLYWDRFKQIYKSSALPAEHAWAYLSFLRNIKTKKLPLRDTQGEAFGYWIPDSFLRLLHNLDQNASAVHIAEDPGVYKENRERFIISSIMEEAIASSQLEGAATTTDIAKDMLRSGRKPKDTAEQMIANNYAAMKELKKYLDQPLSKEMILSIQALLIKDTKEDKDISGRFRTEADNIVVTWDDGTLLHTPPSALTLDERLDRLCEFANSEGQDFVHPVVKGVILHFWLAYDHPFADGNGRTARALFYWYMLKKGYWLMEFIAISRIIKKAPAQYAKAYLYSEAEGNDLTYFIHYHLGVIEAALRDFNEYMKKKSTEAYEAKARISTDEDLNNRQAQLLYRIMTEPLDAVTIMEHKNLFAVTYETARTDLLHLVEKGYLIPRKKGKKFLYAPSEKLRAKNKRAAGNSV